MAGVSPSPSSFKSAGGWIHVWDTQGEEEAMLFRAGRVPLPIWKPYYLVLADTSPSDQVICRSLRHYSSDKLCEEIEVTIGGSRASVSHYTGYSPTEPTSQQLPDSAYEQGSPPGRQRADTDGQPDNMDVTTPSSRIANFFSKRVKSNLKRTKSVTKLDRRKMAATPTSGSGEAASVSTNGDSDGSPKFSLKRTMSLGRLGKKLKYRPGHLSPVHQHSAGPSPGMTSSRSHESLLSSPTQLDSIDLTAPDVLIKPLHSSMLGQDHCFQVTTSHGSKYYSCRSAEERAAWIQKLRQAVEPHQEQTRRTDNSVCVWVQEVKNVSVKKRYFCEVCLDGSVYARTSTKIAKTDPLFWGEQFDFTSLPPIEALTINLYREPEKRKKKEKNVLIGYLRIPMSDVTGRNMVEKWYPVSSATVGKTTTRSEVAHIRVKARYHSVDILPMDMYQHLIQHVEKEYTLLVDLLEPVLSVRAKEELATCLVRVLQKRKCACACLTDIVMNEVDRIENESLAFRGNTIATKAMEAYVKLIADKYLKDTLGDFIRTVLEGEQDCEVDPSRLSNNASLSSNQEALFKCCQTVWYKIINSHSHLPRELKQVFGALRARCAQSTRADMSDTLISACLFLRFLCPAVLSPSLFKLTNELPPEPVQRNLTLIAKGVQNVANFTKFGDKEAYMLFLNEFVESELPSMRDFIRHISSTEHIEEAPEFDGFVDLGKELAVLSALLQENLPKLTQESQEKLSELREILDAIESSLKEPQKAQSTKSNNLTMYNMLFTNNTTSTSTADQTKVDISSEAITNQINEWSAFSSPSSSSKYPGSAFDNPHRNGSLPRNVKHVTNMAVNLQNSNVTSVNNTVYSENSTRNSGVNEQGNMNLDKTSKTKTSLELIGMETIAATGEYRILKKHTTQTLKDSNTFSNNLTKSVNGEKVQDPMTSSASGASLVESRQDASLTSPTQDSSLIPKAQSANLVSQTQTSTCLDSKKQDTSIAINLNEDRLESRHPARKMSEREIASSWEKIVSAAELVNGQGELIDLIKFADQEEESVDNSDKASSVTSENNQPIRTSTSQGHAPEVPPKPLSFTNPLFGQLPSSLVSRSKNTDTSSSHITVSSHGKTQSNSVSHAAATENNASNMQTVSGHGLHFSNLTYVQGVSNVSQVRSASKVSQSQTVSSNNQLPGVSNSSEPSVSLANNVQGISKTRTAQPPQDLAFSWQKYSAINKSADQGWANLHKPQSRAPLSSSLPSQILFSNEQGVSHIAHISPLSQPNPVQGVPNVMQMQNISHHTNYAQVQGVPKVGSPVQGVPGSSYSAANTPDEVFEGDGVGRKSGQGSVRMGVSSVQRRVMEHEKNKSECEEDLTVLRDQLAVTQRMLYDTQQRLALEEQERNQVMQEYERQMKKSQEELHKQTEEKDKQLQRLTSKLEWHQQELRTEQMSLQCALTEKQRVIQDQERRIRSLDDANRRLMAALGQLNDRYTTITQNGVGAREKLTLGDTQGLKSSFC